MEDAGVAAEGSASSSEGERDLRQPADPAESGDERDPAAVSEVQEVITALTRSWVDGDLETHARYYADRVDFYGRPRSRRQVTRARAETLVAFPERTITLNRTAVSFPAAGEATVLVDRSWDFRSREHRWTGAALQEFTLELQEGRWRVTGERNVEVYREDEA